MIRKMNKKVSLTLTIMLSSLLGFIFTSTKGAQVDPIDAILDTPILSIEKASAYDGGGGDCCGSSSTCDSVEFPDPLSYGVGVVTSL